MDYNFENNGDDFLISGAGISITNGIKTESSKMRATSIDAAKTFYLFGCLDVQNTGTFSFSSAPEGTFFDGSDLQWSDMMATHC